MINSFSGEYDFLSNFYELKNGVTAEHIYQAMKTSDVEEQRLIVNQKTPGGAKRCGAKATLRENWEEIKFNVMHEIVSSKFNNEPKLMDKLVATHPQELIEGNNWHDNVWGDCSCKKCKDVVGRNKLGQILITVRGKHMELSKAIENITLRK